MDLRVHAVGEFAGRGSRTVRHHLPEALVVRDFVFDGHWIPPMPPRPPGQADPAPGVSTGRHRPLSDLPMPHRARTGHLLAIAAQATAHCSPPTYHQRRCRSSHTKSQQLPTGEGHTPRVYPSCDQQARPGRWDDPELRKAMRLLGSNGTTPESESTRGTSRR